MKRKLRCISLVLAVMMLVSIPVCADDASTYSSLFFTSYGVGIEKITSTVLEVTYDITATRTMDELGVSKIKIQRSSDGSNWTTVHTFTKEAHPWFICENTGSHEGTARCTTLSGYYYRAKVTYYAQKEGLGVGEYTATTRTVYLS